MPESVLLSDGVKLFHIPSGKYKTNYLSIYFTLPLTEKTPTYMSLLSKVMKRGSESYPTMASLNSALDVNYASTASLVSSKEGEKAVFLLHLSTMKNAYAMNGEDVFGEAVRIALDILFRPLFESVAFESEKKNLHDSIKSQINNKATYARTRFIAEMCEGEPYRINGEGDTDVLKDITREGLISFYDTMLREAVVDIYFVGDETRERVEELLKGAFPSRTPIARPKTDVKTEVKGKDITETLDIAQAHLFAGFRTPASYSHPDYLKFVLFNMVLGGDVSSKMFMNLREKMSLCYTCYSSFDGMKGIISAYAGIDPEMKEKTLTALLRELDKIRAGEISEDELADAKKAYASRMKEIEDNPSLLASYYHMRLESDIAREPLRDAEEIMALTVEDVASAAREVTLDTVYFLTKNAEEK